MKITPTLPLTGSVLAAKIKDMKLPVEIEESYVAAVHERPSVSAAEMRALVDKLASSQADSDSAAAYELNLGGVFPAATVQTKALLAEVREQMQDDPFEVGGAFIAGARALKSDSLTVGQVNSLLDGVRSKMDGPWLTSDHAEGAAWETESLELALGKFLKSQLPPA